MQQESTVSIANDNGERSVPQSIAMRVEFGRRSDLNIVAVDDDYFI